jgi:Alginate lyase/Fibronectin type III domain
LSKKQRRVRGAAIGAVALALVLIKISSAPAYASGTPSAPSNVVAVAGNGSVSVSFTSSSSAGTSSILYYRVSIFENGKDTAYHADGTTSPITVKGLTNGVAYTAKVKARNGSGFGSSSTRTPPFVPGADGSDTPGPTTTTSTTATIPPSTTTPPASTETTSTGADGGGQLLPGEVLDLHDWRLGLPTDSKGGTKGTSRQIKQPRLLTYTDKNFFVNPTADGVVFTAGVGGATTPGSKYPRSELREITPSGALAAWSVASGIHTMTITGSIDHLPVNKPQVVAAQIHGEDTFTFILMASGYCSATTCGDPRYANIAKGTVQLVTKENGDRSSAVVDPDYALGTRYTVTIQVAAGGATTITYRNLASGYTSTRSFTMTSTEGQYFKAGCYTQSDLKRDSPSAFGQTTINALTVTHTP